MLSNFFYKVLRAIDFFVFKFKNFLSQINVIRFKKDLEKDQKLNLNITSSHEKNLFVQGQCLNTSSVYDAISISNSIDSSRKEITEVYLCNGALDMCEFSEPYGENLQYNKNCKKCKSFASKLLKGSSSNIKSFKEVDIDPSYQKKFDLIEREITTYSEYDFFNKEFLGVHLKEHLISTFCRQTLEGFPEELNENHIVRLKKIFINCARAIMIQKSIIKNKSYNRVIMPHGMYLYHGPLVDILKNSKVDVSVYDGHYRRASFVVTKDVSIHKGLKDNLPSKLWDVELSSFEWDQANSYVFSKESDGLLYDAHQYYNYSIKSNDWNEISQKFKNKKIYSLFTNVDWDAQLQYSGVAFSNQLDWIKETIDFFQMQEDKLLVIRVHPAELNSFKSKKSIFNPIMDYLKTKENYDNILLLSKSSDVSSYDLFKVSYAAIIYGSNIALESAIRNIPTIVVGSSDFAQKEIMYMPQNKNEYLDLLECDLEPLKKQVINATKFAYFFYFRICQVSCWSDDLFSLLPKIKKMTKVEKKITSSAFINGTANFNR